MPVFNAVVAFLNGQLGSALVYLLVVVVVDVLLGVVVGHVYRGGFSLRKLADFVVTTLGFQKTVVFLGTLLLMYLRHDALTAAVVTGLAALYATTVLPDIYDKASTLFFAGKLPASQNVAVKPAA